MVSKNQNPWGIILDTMRTQGAKDNPIQPTIGKISSLNPLETIAYGCNLNSSQLMFDDRLTYDNLAVDDKVVLIPCENGNFIILCKIQSASSGLKNDESDKYLIDQLNELRDFISKLEEQFKDLEETVDNDKEFEDKVNEIINDLMEDLDLDILSEKIYEKTSATFKHDLNSFVSQFKYEYVKQTDFINANKTINGELIEIKDKQSLFEQDIDGFKTNVSATYALKKDVENLETGINESLTEITNKQSEMTQNIDGFKTEVSETYATINTLNSTAKVLREEMANISAGGEEALENIKNAVKDMVVTETEITSIKKSFDTVKSNNVIIVSKIDNVLANENLPEANALIINNLKISLTNAYNDMVSAYETTIITNNVDNYNAFISKIEAYNNECANVESALLTAMDEINKVTNQNTLESSKQYVESSILNAKSEIKQTTDAISQSVSETLTESKEYTNASVNGVKETVGNIEKRVQNAENEITKESIIDKISDTFTTQSQVNKSIDLSLVSIQEQIDGKIESYNQDNDPSVNWASAEMKLKHKGDIWYSPLVKKSKQWNGTSWVNLEDATANIAKELAENKNRIFTTTPSPPYDKGDLWMTALDGTGDIKTCINTKPSGSYSANDWIKSVKYTDDSTANQAIANAEVAQQTANDAKTDAINANNKISDISSDSKLTPSEKQSSKLEWDKISNEKEKIVSSANLYNIDTTNYVNKYNDLNSYLATLLNNLNDTSDIVGNDFRGKFTNYYSARQDILNEVSSKAKDISDEITKDLGTVTNRVQTAESKLTKEGLTTTIGDYYTTSTEVEGKIESKGYQTESDVTQTVNKLEAKFTESGGYNWLYNGNFANDTDSWYYSSSGVTLDTTITLNGHNSVKITSSGASENTWKFLSQKFISSPLDTPKTITASMWYYVADKSSFDSELSIEIKGKKTGGTDETWIASNNISSSIVQGEWTKLTVTTTIDTSWDYVVVRTYVTKNGTVWVTDLMVQEGSLDGPWSSHPLEIYDGITTINKKGVTVEASNVSSKTQMTSEGFKIIKTDTNEKVFYVNADGSLTFIGNISASTFSSMNNIFQVLESGEVQTSFLSVDEEISTKRLSVEEITNSKYQAVFDEAVRVYINPSATSPDTFVEEGTYASFADLFAVCPRNLNGYTLSIRLMENVTENVSINKLHSGQVNFEFNGKILYGYLHIYGASMLYRIYGNVYGDRNGTEGKIMPKTGKVQSGYYYGLSAQYTKFMLYDIGLYPDKTNTTNSSGIVAYDMTDGCCYGLKAYGSMRYLVRTHTNSEIYVDSSNGTCNNATFTAVSGSRIVLNPGTHAGTSGTSATYASGNAEVVKTGVTFGTTSNGGTNNGTGEGDTITKTETITASSGNTYRRTVYNSWKNDGTVRQGDYGYGDCDGLWFFGDKLANVLSAGTVTKVTITIKRTTGGSSGTVSHTLVGHNHKTCPSGSPTMGSSILSFNLATNSTTTITLTAAQITNLKKFKGIGLKAAYDSAHYSVCSGSCTIKVTYTTTE